jgi:DeoR/GlpR family transcriptional regulator of sugar metabolism/ABC-type sugar transport system substrate-binding protein
MNMPDNNRLERIIALIEERGFLSVEELSQLCQVSKMTIRRDLDLLEKENRIKRTFGGAASLAAPSIPGAEVELPLPANKPEPILVDRIDVLIATSVNPKYDGRLLESVARREIPIIAESLVIQDEESVVAVDNYRAGTDMGRWAGAYACEKWGCTANILDLTYSLTNTQARSKGFAAGIREIIPNAEIVLSINAQSRYATAYQLTKDALTVHKKINIIFAINDSTAWGAINACKDLHLDPESILVMPFGLEGDNLKNALMDGVYCKAGLAMFPEIVGPTCVEAAIAAFNHQPLPHNIVTPYVIVSSATLPDFYTKVGGRWKLRWEPVKSQLSIPISIDLDNQPVSVKLPRRIGFIVPFSEHDWYKNLIVSMQDYASRLKIGFEVIDAEQNIKDEIDIRRHAIARSASEQIRSGEVILIDGGPIANYLAECLLGRRDITVITNSISIFDILKQNADLTIILTGGAFRHSSGMLVGPTAEGTLRELRADKLFLMVTGASLSFGLSHTNISEVTMKQAMIRSARVVILLADHTYFGQESIVQVAPLTVVNKLITDDALAASVRLDLSKLGIQIILANE